MSAPYILFLINDKVSSYQQLLHKSGGATLYNQRIQNMLSLSTNVLTMK